MIGLGPGPARWLPPESADALERCELLFGYAPYLERAPTRPGQRRVASDNRRESDRARAALEQAAAGHQVGVVSGGDPGVFAMAAAVCEELERGPAAWRELDVRVLPGVTAMLAVAACAGAPLGNDFCAISLSDNLKPWALIERRLDAAARAGFVIALYNPTSRARPWQLARAFARVAEHLPDTTPVIFGRAVGREQEHLRVVPLAGAASEPADMSTLIVIGSERTRTIERPGQAPLVYTPRSVTSQGDPVSASTSEPGAAPATAERRVAR